MNNAVLKEANLYHHWLGIDQEIAQKIAQVQQIDPWERSETDWQALEIYKAAVSRVTTHPGITVDSEIVNGQPVIAGTRVPVELVLGELAAGRTPAEILDSYPSLPPGAINTAIDYVESLPQEHPLTQLLRQYSADCR